MITQLSIWKSANTAPSFHSKNGQSKFKLNVSNGLFLTGVYSIILKSYIGAVYRLNLTLKTNLKLIIEIP